MADDSRSGGLSEADVQRAQAARLFLFFAACVLLVPVGIAAWYFTRPGETEEAQSEAPPPDETLNLLVDSEEWILEYSPKLKVLNRAVENLHLPDSFSSALFESEVVVEGRVVRDTSASGEGQAVRWRVEPERRSVGPAEIDLWRDLLDEVTVESAKFYVIEAHHDPESAEHMIVKVGFEGVMRDRLRGEWIDVRAKQELRFVENLQEEDKATWGIQRWTQLSLTTNRRAQRMFEDVMQQAVVDSALRERLQISEHEKLLISMVKGKVDDPHDFFSTYANGRHPGVSVVDIDGDGWDDLYLMSRIGRNILLRNRGDGTFEDVAAEYGLDIDGFCSSALFADFDNDGDQDLILGRTLRASMYLANEEGKYVDRTEAFAPGVKMPYLVYSVSAADYNNDGLLDVFFATGAQHISRREVGIVNDPNSPLAKSGVVLSQFLEHDKASEVFKRRLQDSTLELVGPPNLLLVNRGDRLEVAPENEQVEVYRTTTQATWSDWDQDGDPDLYLSNDFSINTMFRNDGEDGFTDVTAETQTADIGFGMGVAWGDYDNDQRFDLYVSNMYSKAGRRITAQVDGLDARFGQMARGNTLFRNSPQGFKRVSSLEKPGLLVERVGWSWGSQFIDVDNDGYLDIYAPSGFYTAPQEVAMDVDL